MTTDNKNQQGDLVLIGYLSGLLDGEGCISSCKAGAWQDTAKTSIRIVNTNLESLITLSESFGGHVYPRKSRKPKSKLMFLNGLVEVILLGYWS